jgi:hypothetical protein
VAEKKMLSSEKKMSAATLQRWVRVRQQLTELGMFCNGVAILAVQSQPGGDLHFKHGTEADLERVKQAIAVFCFFLFSICFFLLFLLCFSVRSPLLPGITVTRPRAMDLVCRTSSIRANNAYIFETLKRGNAALWTSAFRCVPALFANAIISMTSPGWMHPNVMMS